MEVKADTKDKAKKKTENCHSMNDQVDPFPDRSTL
jgi:hypothetical protein